MTDDLGAVTLRVLGSIASTFVVAQDLGSSSVSVLSGLSQQFAAPGTLAAPYAATPTYSRSVNFASALVVATDPAPAVGPADPSIWFVFTEDIVADWSAVTTGFGSAVTLELYTGLIGAGPDDLAFLATSGSLTQDLGSMAFSVLGGVSSTDILALDLGVVTVSVLSSVVSADLS